MVIKRSTFGPHGLLAVFWIAASFLSVAITGGRFYGHHTILYLPSLAFLATVPGAWALLRERMRKIMPTRLLRRSVEVLAVSALLYGVSWPVHAVIVDKRPQYDDMAFPVGSAEEQKYIGAFIKSRTTDNDTIIAWGWQAWPIYHWAERYSPSRIYKEMGILTDVNTNSAWSPSKPLHFIPGPIADEYLADVKKMKPSHVIISKWYQQVTRSDVEPLFEFSALADYLKDNYYVHGMSPNFMILERTDLRSRNGQKQSVLPSGWKR
jgi:hypothetical protein